jgi:PPOX class probable F420-dependent enzyme
MAQQIDEKSRALLEDKNFGHVATLNDDGSVHSTVVWVDAEDNRVVLNTAEGRVWPENARRDPRVTITVANSENPYEYTEIRGRVEEDTHEGADEHINAMSKKYIGQDEYPFRAPGEQRVIFRIEPERVRHYGGG